MRLSKNSQRLMPYGWELILQGESTKGSHIKVAIRKRFDTRVQLDEWLDRKRGAIKTALLALEILYEKKIEI